MLAADPCAARAGVAAGALRRLAAPPRPGLERIEHIVVIYAENRSFDNLYGLFPGANGIANATAEQITQVDRDGKPLPRLAAGVERQGSRPGVSHDLPNRPFRIDAPPINLPLSVADARPRPQILSATRSRSTAAATTASPKCRMPAAS